jgi:hypothetical protein
MRFNSSLPADFVKFNGEIKLYQEVVLFYFPTRSGGCLRERIKHRSGTIEQILILVKVENTMYRYSPKKLDRRISQVQLAMTIGKKLRLSKSQQILSKIESSLAALF